MGYVGLFEVLRATFKL